MPMNTTMTDSILELWDNIAQSNEKGLFKRLIQLDNEEIYIYVTFQCPEKFRERNYKNTENTPIFKGSDTYNTVSIYEWLILFDK